MAESNLQTAGYQAATKALLDAMITDITMLRTALNTAITKLNADAGVTDADYAAAAALTATIE